MVCQVDRTGLIGDSRVTDGKAVVIVQRIGNDDIHITGIALLAVRRVDGEAKGGYAVLNGRSHLPETLGDTQSASVQVVLSVVDAKAIIDHAVQCKVAVVNTVGHAADKSTKVTVRGLVVSDGIIAHDHIGKPSAPIGSQETDNSTAEIRNGNRLQQYHIELLA